MLRSFLRILGCAALLASPSLVAAHEPTPAVRKEVAEPLSPLAQTLSAIPEGTEFTIDPKTETVTIVREAPPVRMVTCSGAGCNGTDPQTSGCGASGRTIATNNIYAYGTEYAVVGLLELRWSDVCQTNWSRITRYTFNPPYPYARPFLSTPSGGTYYSWPGSTTAQKWSYQTFAPTTPWRACGSLALDASAPDYVTCTIAL